MAVTAFDETLDALISDLCDTLYATPAGIGFSAPQIDEHKRVLVMDLSDDRDTPEVYVNPEILVAVTPGFVEESCLSVPGVVANIMRATQVRVRAYDRNGHEFEKNLEGMHAVCLQHEIDHLDGRLFVDKLNFLQRFNARRALRALESAAA